MKLEVGMWVRIKNKAGWCCIGKIYNISDFREPSMKYCIDIQSDDFVFIPEDMISKASHSLLGNDEEPCLIEVGDYVNGERVINIMKKHKYLEVSDEEIVIDEKDIKTIVTREQFEQMQYKVGD